MSPQASNVGAATTTRHVAFFMDPRTVIGVDLAGVTGATGLTVLSGTERPRVISAELVETGGSPLEAEERLLARIDAFAPDLIAIDAPLTLPPCMSCPSHCRGPGSDCELRAAQEMWKQGSNPVIRRPCELEARRRVPGLDPKPTMGLGVITARAVSLVRKLGARGRAPSSIARGEVLEVYPAASLRRMGWMDRPAKTAEDAVKTEFFGRVAESLGIEIDGLDVHRRCAEDDDVFDALIAAYTGWLHPDRVEAPPPGFNLATGWIWLPAPDTG